MLKDVYIGDAVQRKLPRNFAVPYIGWHPVEDKMRPREVTVSYVGIFCSARAHQFQLK